MYEIPSPTPFEVAIADLEGKPVRDEDGDVVITWPKFLRALLLLDALVAKLDAIEGTELRLRLKKKFDALKEGDTLALENDECTRMQSALKELRPQPNFAMSCLHFMHALRDAKKVEAE